jgi:hypothetical protein
MMAIVMTEATPKSGKKTAYPFSRIRVYFNAVTGLLALLLSVTFLTSYSDAATVFFYLLVTLAVTLLSLRLKLYLLKRMEMAELDVGYPETDETPRSSFSWQLVAVVVLLALVILLPVISALFISGLWWFIGFSGFIVGFSLSEVLLYQSTRH